MKPITLFLAIILISCNQSQKLPDSIAITSVTLIDGNGGKPIENTNVVILEGKIVCIGKDCDISFVEEKIDGTGKFLIPGLTDSHVHYMANGWVDTFPGILDIDLDEKYPYEEVENDLKNNAERFHKTYLCSGITAIFDVGGYDWSFDVRDKARNSNNAPFYYATGPLMSMLPSIFNEPYAENLIVHLKDRKSIVNGVQKLIANNADAMKLHALDVVDNDSLKLRLQWIKEAISNSNLRLIANAPTLASAKEALKIGVDMLVYSIEDKIVDDEFVTLAKKNNLIYVPTINVTSGFELVKNRSFEESSIFSDCIDSLTRSKVSSLSSYPKSDITTANNKDLRTVQPQKTNIKDSIRTQNLKLIHESKIIVATGSSAGAPLTLHGTGTYNEMEAMVRAGLSPMEVIVSSTKNGAIAMRNKEIGTIENGKIADLVLLNANPLDNMQNIRRINTVIRRGVIFDR
ncbi:MAG: hypothetical protein DRI75_07915 [Bacteroidetes bacterium]|nr:MAG: hypothetical protein DRI75_07915 [Bacteroidota bacterium]